MRCSCMSGPATQLTLSISFHPQNSYSCRRWRGPLSLNPKQIELIGAVPMIVAAFVRGVVRDALVDAADDAGPWRGL